jgi:hypothetical protein
MSRALSLAGFQVTLIGRICVTPEAQRLFTIYIDYLYSSRSHSALTSTLL